MVQAHSVWSPLHLRSSGIAGIDGSSGKTGLGNGEAADRNFAAIVGEEHKTVERFGFNPEVSARALSDPRRLVILSRAEAGARDLTPN